MPSSAVQTCALDRKSTRLNSSHTIISYAVFCLKKNHGGGATGLGYKYGSAGLGQLGDALGPLVTAPLHDPLLVRPVLDVPAAWLFFFLKERATPEFYPFPLPDPFPV